MSANTTITATVTGALSGSVAVDLFSEYRKTLKINDADGLAAVVFLGLLPGAEQYLTRYRAGDDYPPGLGYSRRHMEDGINLNQQSAAYAEFLCEAYVRFPYVLCEAGGLIGNAGNGVSKYVCSGFYDWEATDKYINYSDHDSDSYSDDSEENIRMSTFMASVADYCYASHHMAESFYFVHYGVYSRAADLLTERNIVRMPRNFRFQVGRAVQPADLPYLVKGYPEAGGVCTLVATDSQYGGLINGHRWTDEEFMQHFSSGGGFIAIREALEANPDYFPSSR